MAAEREGTRAKSAATAGFKSATGARAHLIFGDDEYQVAQAARKLVDQLCPPAEQAFGLEVYDGAADNSEAAAQCVARTIEALRTVGFMAGRKVVWLRGADFMADTIVGRAAATKAALADLASEVERGLPAGQTLVISAGKLDKRAAFYKACQKYMQVTEYGLPEKGKKQQEQIHTTSSELFRQAGLRISADALTLFIDRVGQDSRLMAQEVEKLAVYLGERREVTRADVATLVSCVRESEYWEFAEAVTGGTLESALDILRRQIFHGGNEVGLIISLENRLRELLLFRDCLDRKLLRIAGSEWRPTAEWDTGPEADTLLGAMNPDPRKGHPYRVLKLAQQARMYSRARLAGALKRTVAAHEKLVSAGGAKSLQLEFLVIRLMQGLKAAAR